MRRETVGPADCPLFHRWTLVPWSWRLPFKVMVHHFLPDASERDEHDHPWDFVTVVLRGGYDDISGPRLDPVRAPAVRCRRAEHRHRTATGASGAWTVVVTRRPRRPWGFYLRGEFVPWHRYVREHGDRCD